MAQTVHQPTSDDAPQSSTNLFWTPGIDASQVQVAAAGGAVAQSGAVGNYPETFVAEQPAELVSGVTAIDQDTVVHSTGRPPTTPTSPVSPGTPWATPSTSRTPSTSPPPGLAAGVLPGQPVRADPAAGGRGDPVRGRAVADPAGRSGGSVNRGPPPTPSTHPAVA